jgi:hypothetical protein
MTFPHVKQRIGMIIVVSLVLVLFSFCCSSEKRWFKLFDAQFNQISLPFLPMTQLQSKETIATFFACNPVGYGYRHLFQVCLFEWLVLFILASTTIKEAQDMHVLE